MPDVISLLEPRALDQPTPRRIPPLFVLNLLGEHLLARPPQAWFDPFLIGWVIAFGSLSILGVHPSLLIILAVLLPIRLILPSSRLLRDVREDYLLVRHGLTVTAYVLAVRTGQTPTGEAYGAYLDCAIPLPKRRTTVGSVWIADHTEAMRLSAAGSLPVICLPYAPGVWRLCEATKLPVRYDPEPIPTPQ